MNTNAMQDILFKNHDRPFTEMFSLLKRYDFSVENIVSLSYSHKELICLERHACNAIDALIQGVKCLGDLMVTSSAANKEIMSDVGNFISLISDLIESLITVRMDVDSSL